MHLFFFSWYPKLLKTECLTLHYYYDSKIINMILFHSYNNGKKKDRINLMFVLWAVLPHLARFYSRHKDRWGQFESVFLNYYFMTFFLSIDFSTCSVCQLNFKLGSVIKEKKEIKERENKKSYDPPKTKCLAPALGINEIK